MRADGEIGKEEYLSLKEKCESEIKSLQNELTPSVQSDTIETRKIVDLEKIEERLNQLIDFPDGKVPNEIIEEFVAAIVPEEDGKHFNWYLTLDDEEYHQSFCTLDGRKNTLSLDVKTVQDDEGLPTFFHNQYFAEVDEIGKNPYQRGVLHKLISKIRENSVLQILISFVSILPRRNSAGQNYYS